MSCRPARSPADSPVRDARLVDGGWRGDRYGVSPSPSPARRRSISRPLLGGLLYLAAASVPNFSLYYPVVRKIGPGKAAYSSVLVPIIAMGFSTWLEGYRWTPLTVAGAPLALGGMAAALSRSRSKVAPPEPTRLSGGGPPATRPCYRLDVVTRQRCGRRQGRHGLGIQALADPVAAASGSQARRAERSQPEGRTVEPDRK